MLGRSLTYSTALTAFALLASSPAAAQVLDQRLTEAEQKLSSDGQGCQPINLGEYGNLLRESAVNKQRAEKAKKAGVPADDARVNADLYKAASLFNRAVAAHAQQCVRQAVQGQGTHKPFDGRVLELHNTERAALGLEPFYWNTALAEGAQAHANQLAQTGQPTHASREGRGIERENLSQGLLNWTADQLMGNWFNEKQFFTPGIFPNVSTTGDWSQVGHYSQMIWPTTTDIGCGIAQGNGFSWLVCRYSPGGNKDGKPVGTPGQIAQDQAPTISEQSSSLSDLAIILDHIISDYQYGFERVIGYDLGGFRLEAEAARRPADVDSLVESLDRFLESHPPK